MRKIKGNLADIYLCVSVGQTQHSVSRKYNDSQDRRAAFCVHQHQHQREARGTIHVSTSNIPMLKEQINWGIWFLLFPGGYLGGENSVGGFSPMRRRLPISNIRTLQTQCQPAEMLAMARTPMPQSKPPLTHTSTS